MTLTVTATCLAIAPIPRGWLDWVFLGCWLSVAASAATVHLIGGLRPRWAYAASLNAGLWSGAVIALGGSRLDLLKAMPCVLVLFPAALVIGLRATIAVKVVASWLIAIAVLAAWTSTRMSLTIVSWSNREREQSEWVIHRQAKSTATSASCEEGRATSPDLW